MEVLKYFVEFLGTFLFLSVILASGSPVLIALSLLAVILLGGSISGGHFNPAVSVMMWFNGVTIPAGPHYLLLHRKSQEVLRLSVYIRPFW